MKLVNRIQKEKNGAKTLDLSQNHIGVQFLKSNSKMMGEIGESIMEINLSYNRIDEKALYIMSDAFNF